MTNTVAGAVEEVMPPDDELVFGTVLSGNPLTVRTRGGDVPAGRLNGTAADAGDPVAMIRQDATWLMLGSTLAAGAPGFGITFVQRVAQDPGVLNLTAAEQDVPGTTVTFTTSAAVATVVAVWFADYQVLVAATATGVTMLRLDGVTDPTAATWRDSTAANRGTTGQANVLTVGPGTHTAVLRANRAGGADGQLRLNPLHTSLLLVVLQ
jgi:hypothetical protein